MIGHVLWILTPACLALGAIAAAPGLPSLFVTSDRCMSCHNGMVTPAGEDISFGTDWRSSMMANSARDPYWQAAVRREALEHPTVAEQIQHECAACHMPMSRYTAKTAGVLDGVFAHLPAGMSQAQIDRLAVDGVSCAICHQIGPQGLGDKSSFTAGFEIDTTTPLGRREAFGPYDVDAGRQALMRSASLFLPQRASHVRSSELCATCHTLFTHALEDDGTVIGEFPEQVPYLEWKHSDYAGTRSCQSCHMPEVEGEVPITSVLGTRRPRVARHVFRGGNFLMPRILSRYAGTLGVQAGPRELQSASSRTADHLRTNAARLLLQSVEVSQDRLRAKVTIENLAGHKLPSAYPSRRVWLRFTVRDAAGRAIFDSGRLEPDGSIAGNDNDDDAARFEPHHELVTRAEDVQIYESIMADPGGEVTTVLLRATRYLKDNRILPQGFDKATAEDDIAVRGGAVEDGDFVGGGDRVRYEVDLRGAQGPFEVEAQLWYQPIAFRWARNLAQRSAPETDRFVRLYDEMAGVSGIMLGRALRTAP